MSFGGGGFGSTSWGSTNVGFLLVGYGPTTVAQDGGYEISLSGLENGTYQFHFGPNLDATDSRCYSGVQGSGYDVVITDGTASVWVPPTPVGAAGFHLVRQQGSGSATITTDLIIQVVPFPFRHSILGFRKLFPPAWRTGYRDPEDLDLQS